MLAVRDIHVRFGGVAAVAGVSFEVGAGEALGVVGPNGSGKTTLLNALTGVVEASGTATLDSRPLPLGRPAPLAQAGLARVFQAPQIFPSLTVLENVLLGSAERSYSGYLAALTRRRAMLRAERARWAAAHAMLDQVGIASLAGKPAASLTYGQQRIVELCRALSAQPRVLMLDEPSAGMNDAEWQTLVTTLESVRSRGTALVLVDHKIDFVERLCPRLLVMDFGKVLVTGPPEQVWQDPRVVEAYLGVTRAAT